MITYACQFCRVLEPEEHKPDCFVFTVTALRAENAALAKGQKALKDQTIRIRRALCENDAMFHFAEDTEAYAKMLRARVATLEAALREIAERHIPTYQTDYEWMRDIANGRHRRIAAAALAGEKKPSTTAPDGAKE